MRESPFDAARHGPLDARRDGYRAWPDRPAVAQGQADVGERGQVGVMSDEQQCRAARALDAQQQVHDVTAGRRIQIAGRLVGEHDDRIVGQRTGERDALLLAARELRRVMVSAIGQSHLVEQPSCAGGRVASACNFHRNADVLEGGQRRNEMEELEDEPDLLAAQSGELVLAERGDIGAVNQDRPRRGRVEAGNQTEQCRLAAARGADDREELTRGDREVQGMKDRERTASAHHRLGYAAELDHGLGGSSRGWSVRHTFRSRMRAPSGFG